MTQPTQPHRFEPWISRLVLQHGYSVIYSRRIQQPAGFLERQTLEEPGEVGSGELPLEWLGEMLVAVLEREDPLAVSSSSEAASAGVSTLRSRMLK